ncbi:MAG: ABC transporter substrate-binding protein, partial [Planctomycetaceae bacterium]
AVAGKGDGDSDRGAADPDLDPRPRIAGYTSILSPEPDRARPPDDEIDWHAELRTAFPLEPKGLNLYTSDRDRYVATDLGYYLYTPLALRKDAGKDTFKPGLAVRVEVSPDHTEFRIWLREGVLWHRPAVDLTDPGYAWMKGDHEVTSADVIFALRMIKDTRADTDSIRSEFEDIVEYEAIDRYSFRIKWKEANFYSTGVLLGDLQPLPAWIYTREQDGTPIDEASLGPRFAAHWFNKNMCGYGPYRFKEYKQSDYILLERNEAWWGRRPGFRFIRYTLNLRDDEPRYNLFMMRDDGGRRMQYAYPIASTRLKREVYDSDGSSKLLRELAERKLNIWGYQRMMYAYLGWACRGKFFNDARARRAMTMATNRSVWEREILLNQAIFPTGVAFTESPEYDRSVQPWPYDLEAAARLLDEAGWKDLDGNGVREKTIAGEKVEFRFKAIQTPGSPDIDAMRSDMEQALRKIGVIMEAEYMEWNQFLKRTKDRDFEACWGAWFHGDDFDPKSIFHSRQIEVPGSQNYVQWSTPRADAVIDQLKTTFDLKERYKLAHELHAIFHEEQPYTIMWSWRNSVAVDARMGGLVNPRPFSPQNDILNLYYVKNPPAPYDDGRYDRPTK